MTEIGEIIRTAVRYTAPGASEMLNIFHHVVADAATTDALVLEAIELWINADWGPDWADQAADQAELTDIQVDVVNNDGTVARSVGVALIGLAGTQGSSVLPAAASAYILLKTILPKIRGIKYIPAWSEDAQNDGEWDALALVNMAQLLLHYAAPIPVTGGASLTSGVLSTSLTAFQPFIGTGQIESLPAYQRRRKRGVGS